MSEMTALEYSKARGRMTNNCKIHCTDCPLGKVVNTSDVNCHTFLMKYPEKAIEIVEKWAKQNPVKTYKDIFFERCPNAPRSEIDGYPLTDVRYVFGGKFNKCGEYYKTWDEEYKEPRP